jgi:hypothetical protein
MVAIDGVGGSRRLHSAQSYAWISGSIPVLLVLEIVLCSAGVKVAVSLRHKSVEIT